MFFCPRCSYSARWLKESARLENFSAQDDVYPFSFYIKGNISLLISDFGG